MANILTITKKHFIEQYCNNYEEQYKDIPPFIVTSTPDDNLRLINKYSQGYKTIFEIGTWIGRSALGFSQNFKKVKTIDYIEGSDISYDYGGRKSGELCMHLENVEYLHQDSTKYSNFLEKFDCVYVDGNHTYEGCKHDIELSRKLCNNGGLIFIDDYYNPSFGVSKAVNELSDDLYCIEGTTLVFIINRNR